VSLDLASFQFATDGRGLRTGQGASDASPDATRILFLGDSVTLSWGVEDGQAWVRRLERMATAKDGGDLHCMNAGHLQFNTLQEADWFRTHGAALAPDTVVVTVLVNDLTDDAWALYQAWRDAAANAPTGLAGAMASARGWFRGIEGLLEFRRESVAASAARTANGAEQSVQDHPAYAGGLARVQAGLESMRQTAAALGASLIVFDHTSPEIPAVAEWCRGAGVPCHRFVFSPAEWARDVRNSSADSHANALGNQLLADKAWAALAGEGILAPAPAQTPNGEGSL